MILSRRSLLTGLGSLLAAPAIVRADTLMPIRGTLFEPWVRFQSWPIGTPAPVEHSEAPSWLGMRLLPRRDRLPPTLGPASGIVPLKHFASTVQHWERVHTEPVLIPKGQLARDFLREHRDMKPTQGGI